MATRNSSYWRKSFNVFLIIFVFLAGCGTPQTRTNQGSQTGVTGAQNPSGTSTNNEKTPLKVGVILGPGGARAFAHLGVLKELLHARVPIDAVVGVEWGSLVAALYAQNGQIHEAEWKLYKLESREFTSHSFFGVSHPQSVKSLEGFFSENLRGRGIAQGAVRFACPGLSVWSGAFQWQDKGEYNEALKKCLPSPPILKPSGPWAASLASAREAALWLKKQGYNLIILVDVLKSPDYFDQEKMLDDQTLSTLYFEMRRSYVMDRDLIDDVVEVDAKGFKVVDFEKRRDLVSLGSVLAAFRPKLSPKNTVFRAE